MKEDLRFLLGKFKRPRVAWHDPNFGVRFDCCMDAIEEVVPPGRIDFIAESTLSLLTEKRVQRLKHNGFKALLPGIESWFNMGNKSRTGKTIGIDKVRKVSDHINMILEYIPYVQTNHIVGLDGDEGPEPFELTPVKPFSISFDKCGRWSLSSTARVINTHPPGKLSASLR